MNDIFSDLLDVCVVIYPNNMSEHHQHVKEVLKHLRKAGLYAKVEKCKFYSESVEYLGYILSPSGLIMSNDKVKIILQLLGHCHSIDMPHPERHSLEVQLLLSRCFQLSQESIHLYTYSHLLDS